VQNLSLDPWGRVVDVAFGQSVNLVETWDRFRFAIDIVQPLARDGGGFVGDLTGDGINDLLLADWNGSTLFYPGISGKPRQFERY
jgi:hypothetical protein